MKKIFFAMGALVALAGSSSVEGQFNCCEPRCGCDNWYIGGFGGLNWVNKKGHSSHDKYKVGYLVGGDIGYRWDNGFRLEAEVSYRNNQRKNHGKAKQTTAILANGLYAFEPDCFPVSFYFGGGIGWANTQRHNHNHNHNKNNGFVWQLIAGIAYPICENLELDLEYRFFDESQSKFNNNSVDLGLRYFF